MIPISRDLVAIVEAGEKKLIIQTYGGTFGDAEKVAFYDPFSEEFDVEVVMVTSGGDTHGKVEAQIRSGNIEWDVTTSSYYTDMMAAVQKNHYEEVDYDIVTNTKDLIPGAVQKYGLGLGVTTYVVTYNTETFPEGKRPRSWKDFYDVEAFPGPRAMPNWGSPEVNILSALLADGVAPEKLVPIDFDRAFKVLDRIKPHVKIWYVSGDQLLQGLMEGEVVLANSTYARSLQAKKHGSPIALEWNQGIYFVAYSSVVKGAPHKDLAMQFLNFCTRPEQQAVYTNHCLYSGSNMKSVRYLPPEVQKDQATHPDNVKVAIDIEKYAMPWTMEHWDEIVEKYNKWLAM
jgi:putative spermidine/putrescine transport system substrate-binding protein